MAFLDLSRVTLTPMLYAVLEWVGPSGAIVIPNQYTITAVSADPEHVVTMTVDGTKTIARLGQLNRPAVYTITITAEYDDPDDNVSAVYDPFAMDVKSGYAQILRQAVWDAVFDAGLTHLSRSLTCMHDGKFRPVEWPVKKGGFSPTCPVLEVCSVELDSDGYEDLARKVQRYTVPIKLWENGSANDPDTMNALWLLLERVQKAIDDSPGLGLRNAGVHHRSWEWRKKKGLLKGRDSVTGFHMELLVPVQRMGGTVAMS